MDLLPSINQVFAFILQHERKHYDNLHSALDYFMIGSADARRIFGRGRYSNGKMSRECSFSGKLGHTIETCYMKSVMHEYSQNPGVPVQGTYPIRVRSGYVPKKNLGTGRIGSGTGGTQGRSPA